MPPPACAEIWLAIMPGMGEHALHRVAIVGAGTAGPAAGAFLARRGWRVDLFERSPALRPIGAGLLIQPTGQFVLDRLGKLDWIAARGAPVHRLSGVTRRGRRVLEAAYADCNASLHGIGVTRGTLFRACLDACRDAGAHVHEGHEVRARHADGRGVRLSIVTSAGASETEAFDLVLVCDGARSALRPAWARSRAYPWGAAWCVLPDHEGVFAHALSQVYDGVGTMVGFLPVGRDEPGGPRQVAMFWSVRADRLDALLRGEIEGIDAFKARIVSLMPRAEGVISHLVAWSQLIGARYFDAVTSPAMDHGGRVLYLGDAAHAMSPQLGQGANLALWDAWELSQRLPRGDEAIAPDALEDAAHAWWRSRRRHTRFYRLASRWLTPWFQSDWRVLGPVRDLCMHPMSRVPWIKRQMVQSLAGVKTGVWSAMQLPRG